MGQIESIPIENIQQPKISSKIIISDKTYHVKEIVDHYNNLIESLKFFQIKANEYLVSNNKKDKQIEKLKNELLQLKSVLDIKVEPDSVTSDKDIGDLNINSKRHAVSAETVQKNVKIAKTPKSTKIKNLIQNSIQKNDFLEHLDKTQISELVDYMTMTEVKAGQFVIKEGESGDRFYVIEDGTLEVTKKDKVLPTKPLGSGVLFGELAILYNCTRTASIRAISDATLWCVQRDVFQYIMQSNVTGKRLEYLKFLQSVPSLSNVNKALLKKVVDAVEEVSYNCGECIIREGEKGETFYVLKTGKVDVMINNANKDPETVRSLEPGSYFGERALLKDEVRSATIIVTSTSATCLVITREIFLKIAGDISEVLEGKVKDKSQDVKVKKSIPIAASTYKLQDLLVVTTLGQGAFGKVDLVIDPHTNKNFALKKMDKSHIVKTKQQEHVNNERTFLITSNSPFVVRIHQTFKDNKSIFLLLDACLGGDLFSIMHTVERFEPKAARFYVACVIEGFDYVHSRNYVYRDLKPENMIMDSKGYVKLTDFGFAKKIEEGEKTFTFCGTPEYVAPEVILSKGHDRAADLWSLGILVFELINGSPPFSSNDSMTTYRMILRGIDNLSMPKRIPKYAQHLIRHLCTENQTERLGNSKEGIMSVRKHKWFDGFHWQGLQACTLSPPLLPRISSFKDLSKYKRVVTSDSNQEDLTSSMSGWDEEF